MSRAAIADAKRIVVKIGSSSLSSRDGGLDISRLRTFVDAIAARRREAEIVVVSSGAIATGLAPLQLSKRPSDLPTQQAAAAVGQGLLLSQYTQAFAEHGLVVAQVLLTVDDMSRRSQHANAQRTFLRLLEFGTVPIVNENDTVATAEIQFGDNDRLAALVAHVIRADALILLSDVDGLYDGPPGEGATLIRDIRSSADLEAVKIGGIGNAGVGRGGMATKVDAARIATAAGIPVVLTNAEQVQPALAGEGVGTYFHPASERRSTRFLWLEYATSIRGAITVDAGAKNALQKRGSSLLAAGVTGVDGEFTAGDPVEVRDDHGTAFARGIVNFDADDLRAMRGRTTTDLAAELGEEFGREVIHRDDLVLMRRG
jgi:glutamate 5-kinase